MDNGVDAKLKVNPKKVLRHFIIRNVAILILIGTILIGPYYLFANYFVEYMIDNIIINSVPVIFIIIILIGVFGSFFVNIIKTAKKMEHAKMDFFSTYLIYDYLDERMKTYSIKLPYKNIINVRIKKTVDDMILETAKVIIEFENSSEVKGPIMMLGKPITLLHVENYEEIRQYLINQKETAKYETIKEELLRTDAKIPQ